MPLDQGHRVRGLTSGWGWLSMLRLGLALAMGLYAGTYRPLPGHPLPPVVRPLALAAAGLLLALGGGFLSGELSGERARRQVEREEELRRLQEAEAKYRVLVEQIPVVTYIDAADASGFRTYISPQVEEVLGYPPREWT